MPLLDWVNRHQAEETADNVPYHLLKFEEAYGNKQKAKENLIIQGDNLQALKALLPLYGGQVKCIFIDPPYNTEQAFEHYDDKLEHAQWLTTIYPRLQLLKNLLKEDGSIWISVDDSEAHYLKVICDEVFGRENFVANVIWQKKYSPQNDAKWLSDNHDHILVYAKDKKTWRPNLLPRSAAMDSRYKNPDNDPRDVWKSSDLSVKTFSKLGNYPIITPSGRVVTSPSSRAWSVNKEEFERLVAEDRIWFGEDGSNVPSVKKFLSEVKSGSVSLTIWPYEEVGHNQDAKKEVKLFNSDDVFDTPKPEHLIKKILTLATSKGDLVLDSFLGSGTTCAVAHKMERNYIGIEMGEHARTHVIPRLKKVIEGEQGGISVKREYYELKDETLKDLDLDINDIKKFNKVLQKIAKETNLIDKNVIKTIKQATRTQKIKSESVWDGGGGFSFYTLGSAVFDEQGFLHSDVKFSDLASYVWWLETHTAFISTNDITTPFLGVHEGVAYYLLYNGILGDRKPNGGNVLTNPILEYLNECHQHEGKRIIIGEATRIGSAKLETLDIEFKQIPYALYVNHAK